MFPRFTVSFLTKVMPPAPLLSSARLLLTRLYSEQPTRLGSGRSESTRVRQRNYRILCPFLLGRFRCFRCLLAATGETQGLRGTMKVERGVYFLVPRLPRGRAATKEDTHGARRREGGGERRGNHGSPGVLPMAEREVPKNRGGHAGGPDGSCGRHRNPSRSHGGKP